MKNSLIFHKIFKYSITFPFSGGLDPSLRVVRRVHAENVTRGRCELHWRHHVCTHRAGETHARHEARDSAPRAQVLSLSGRQEQEERGGSYRVCAHFLHPLMFYVISPSIDKIASYLSSLGIGNMRCWNDLLSSIHALLAGRSTGRQQRSICNRACPI